MGRPAAMFEIVSGEPERAKAFYTGLFDWRLDEPADGGGYALVDTGAEEPTIGGGIGPSTGEGDAGVKVYVRVDDLERYLERAVELGGRRVSEPMDLPEGFGSFAVLADPDGNHVGLWA